MCNFKIVFCGLGLSAVDIAASSLRAAQADLEKVNKLIAQGEVEVAALAEDDDSEKAKTERSVLQALFEEQTKAQSNVQAVQQFLDALKVSAEQVANAESEAESAAQAEAEAALLNAEEIVL